MYWYKLRAELLGIKYLKAASTTGTSAGIPQVLQMTKGGPYGWLKLLAVLPPIGIICWPSLALLPPTVWSKLGACNYWPNWLSAWFMPWFTPNWFCKPSLLINWPSLLRIPLGARWPKVLWPPRVWLTGNSLGLALVFYCYWRLFSATLANPEKTRPFRLTIHCRVDWLK